MSYFTVHQNLLEGRRSRQSDINVPHGHQQIINPSVAKESVIPTITITEYNQKARYPTQIQSYEGRYIQ